MKAKNILMASALAISSASLALAADIEIRITGATAFRASADSAIQNILGSPTVSWVGTSTSASANQAIYRGTLGSDTVTIKTTWSGSAAGVGALALQTQPVLDWLDDEALGTPGQISPEDAADLQVPGIAHAAFSDVYQGSTIYTQYSDPALPTDPHVRLEDNPVGVIPFVFVRGSSSNSATAPGSGGAWNGHFHSVTNITTQQARLIWEVGAPLSFFTKNEDHFAFKVLPLGRNDSSGTRITTLAEINFPTYNLTPVINQYQASVSGSAITAVVSIGGGGESSGGTLAGIVGNSVAANATVDSATIPFGLVTYLGISDAANVAGITFNGTTGEFGSTSDNLVLSYNGVPFSYDAVKEGKYTLWGYEHVYYRPTLGSPELPVVTALINQIVETDAAVAGILLEDVNVTRQTEGGVVYP